MSEEQVDAAEEFLLTIAKINTTAHDLQSWSVDHLLSVVPEKVDWGHVGYVNSIMERLEQLMDELPAHPGEKAQDE